MISKDYKISSNDPIRVVLDTKSRARLKGQGFSIPENGLVDVTLNDMVRLGVTGTIIVPVESMQIDASYFYCQTCDIYYRKLRKHGCPMCLVKNLSQILLQSDESPLKESVENTADMKFEPKFTFNVKQTKE